MVCLACEVNGWPILGTSEFVLSSVAISLPLMSYVYLHACK